MIRSVNQLLWSSHGHSLQSLYWMAGDMEYLIISLVGRQKPVPEFEHAMAIDSHGEKGVGPLAGLTVVGPWKQRKSFALTWLSNQAYLFFPFYF